MAEYIEREKLAKAFKIWKNTLIENYGKNDEYVRCLNSVLLGIDNAPAADVRPVRHGRWTGHDIGNGRLSIDDDTCSLCGSLFYQIAETGCVWHYCPNCGADMREENK